MSITITLTLLGVRSLVSQRQRAQENAQNFGVDILRRLFADHPVDAVFELPTEHPRVPQIAQAWKVFVNGIDSAHGNQAIKIYRSITAAQRLDKDGKDDQELLYAIATGEAVAAFLAGDLDAARNSVRKAALIDPQAERLAALDELLTTP